MAEENKNENEKAEEASSEEGEGEEKKKKSLMPIILPLAGVLVGIGISFVLGMFNSPPPPKNPAPHAAAGKGGHGEGHADENKDYDHLDEGSESGEKKKPKEAYYVEMPSITVNLRSTPNQRRYLKLSVRFEIAKKDHEDVINKIMPRIRDQFQVFLRELRVDDLEGATGAYRLREELLIRINAVSKPAVVTDVLFDELLIQ